MRRLMVGVIAALSVWFSPGVIATAAESPPQQGTVTRTVDGGTFNCADVRAQTRKLLAAHPELRTRDPNFTAWAESTQPEMDTCRSKITITQKIVGRQSASFPGTTTALAWDGQQSLHVWQDIYSGVWPNPWLATGHVAGNVWYAAGCCTQAVDNPSCWTDTQVGYIGGVDSCFWEWPNAGTCCTGADNNFWFAPFDAPFIHFNHWVKAWVDSWGNVSAQGG